MLHDQYNLDSDSDDDENSSNSKDAAYPLVQDIQALKMQTTELLDPDWKESRNRHLLMKMLKLEEPTITAKMVDFLLQDGVCEILLGFVTLVGTGQPRPTPNDNQSEALKLSYKAVVVLSADEPSEPLINLFSKRTVAITRTMFEIFREDSAASFYHAFRIFECLLRCFPGDVYEGICGDGKAAERMQSLLKYIGFAPIDVIVNPEKYCYITAEVDAEEHSSAASQVFQELVEKLSLEDVGEILLQPLGYTTALLDLLVNTAVTNSAMPTGGLSGENSRRRTAIQLLCFLLRRAAEPEVMCMVAGAPGNMAQPSIVANRVHPLRERIICHLETRMSDVFVMIARFANVESKYLSAVEGPIVYSAYTVDQPFTAMRALLIEYMVLMIESDETIATQLPVYLWRLLMQWTLQYAQNSIFHAFFYRLVFAVLRQSQDEALRTVFQKAKIVTFLMESFVPLSSPSDNLPKDASAELIANVTCRGLIMNCTNAIRLQASCMPPGCYIRQFISKHPRWSEFMRSMLLCTEYQQRFGMGIKIAETRNSMSSISSLMMMSPNEYKFDASDSGIDHGSRYAKTLGFYDDIPWTAADDDEPIDYGDLSEVSASELKRVEAEGLIGMQKQLQLMQQQRKLQQQQQQQQQQQPHQSSKS